MSTEADRRAHGASRIPFEALVEVGGALGPSFEAQAVNISEAGMQLRTAYLPEAGQPLTCRFDAGPGQSVLASGEVVWAEQAGKGGEFAIRFTDIDPESVDVLRRMCGVAAEAAPAAAGSKVRLHIDGLNSPMRARIKDSHRAEVTVGSDLGFLQVGKDLELEDAETGTKRPARIDRVDVIVDPTSHIPQLVVTLRYAEAGASTGDVDDGAGEGAPIDVHEDAGGQPHEMAMPSRRGVSASSHDDGDLESAQRAAGQMKGAFARGMSSIGPAFAKIATRAKTTVALIAAKRGEGAKDDAAMPRRTTAPAPGGGLHTAGRRVIRGDSSNDSQSEDAIMEPTSKFPKRKVAIAGAVAMAVILGAFAMRSPSTPATPTAGAETSTTTTVDANHLTSPAIPKLESISANLAAPPATQGAAPMMPNATPMGMGNMPDMDTSPAMTADDKATKGSKKGGKITPFGNGPVAHGNVLRLKMDGPIEAIQGAQQPTGFTVKLPNRKSIEAAGPLAARDARIASIKVTNDGAGAELTVTFKDGVPNYQVRAKGDYLEISLAPLGKPKADKLAKKDGASKHHGAIANKKHGDKSASEKTGDKSPDKH
jgi:hypothetical protein